MTPDQTAASAEDEDATPLVGNLPPVDATQQAAMEQQAKLATGPWSVKPQEVTDAHSGLTLTFGNRADDSNTVYLILAHNGLGSIITFQRDGAVLKCQPLQTPTDAQRQTLAKAAAAEKPQVQPAQPGPRVDPTALQDGLSKLVVPPAEPFKPNPHAPAGSTPLPDTPPPATE